MTVATNLPLEARAFLDALAIGESGSDNSKSYHMLFGGGIIGDLSKFPEWEGVRGSWGITHAAGRYQDQPATWRTIAAACNLNDFMPASQDIGNWWLAQRDYKARSGHDLLDVLRRSEPDGAGLGDVATQLKPTWTSLDAAKFPKRYAAAMRALQASTVPATSPLTLQQLTALTPEMRTDLAVQMRKWAALIDPGAGQPENK